MDINSCGSSSCDVASCELAGGIPELFQGFPCVSPPLYPIVLAVPYFLSKEAHLLSLGQQVESPVNTATYLPSFPSSLPQKATLCAAEILAG